MPGPECHRASLTPREEKDAGKHLREKKNIMPNFDENGCEEDNLLGKHLDCRTRTRQNMKSRVLKEGGEKLLIVWASGA